MCEKNTDKLLIRVAIENIKLSEMLNSQTSNDIQTCDYFSFNHTGHMHIYRLLINILGMKSEAQGPKTLSLTMDWFTHF
ncbi:MAG: hypothetical protein ACI9QV_000795 [Methylophagaceae bacterium]|jgi:hypothetical protein